MMIFSVFLISCAADTPSPAVFSIVSYNVQNLMDAVADGTEYDEYKPENGWTDTAYKARLRRLSEVLRTPDIRDADVLVFQEIEHAGVMEDLMRRHLSRYGWIYYAVVKDPTSPIGIGIASRVRPDSVFAHHGVSGRPVLEAVYSVGGERIVLYGVHGKSQKGENTEAARIDMVKTVASAATEWPDALVLVCGDFNEDPDCCLETRNQTALVLLDLPDTSLFVERGSLPVTGERRRVSGPIWYCPYLDGDLQCYGQGSYVYRSEWHQYDQFLGQASLFDKKGWEFLDFSVISQPECLNADGTPQAWDRNLLSGYSDHLPVRCRLISF